jgi:hypothetical protein
MIVAGKTRRHYEVPDPFWTALIGVRVRFVRRGEPFYGVIVQINESGHNTIVALDDGAFRRLDVTDLERVDTIEQMLTPYRDVP